MMSQIALQPLFDFSNSKSLQLEAGAMCIQTDLVLQFKVMATDEDEMKKIIFSEKSSNQLWTETCFECFIPSIDSTHYLEFNGAPNGNWNFYSFRDYREGMHEVAITEENSPRLTFSSKSETEYQCEWRLPLENIHFNFESVGLSVVINTGIEKSYWALKHAANKPDFHVRSSFCYSVKESL